MCARNCLAAVPLPEELPQARRPCAARGKGEQARTDACPQVSPRPLQRTLDERGGLLVAKIALVEQDERLVEMADRGNEFAVIVAIACHGSPDAHGDAGRMPDAPARCAGSRGW